MPAVGRREKLLMDFVTLAKWEHHFNDHGPQVYLMTEVARLKKLNLEERLWLTLIAMAFYHEGSGWVAYTSPGVRQRKQLPPIDMPIGTLRRNLYGGRIKRHLEELYELGNIYEWLQPFGTWEELIAKLNRVWGNGAWSSYTTAEALLDIAPKDIPVEPDEFGFLANTGPRKGLKSLGIPVTKDGVLKLRKIMKARGVEVPINIMETVMCNWNNMRAGAFYIGRSLDRQQSRIMEIEDRRDCSVLWEARKSAFPNDALGELQGWLGLDKPRLRHYKKTGKLLLPWENR